MRWHASLALLILSLTLLITLAPGISGSEVTHLKVADAKSLSGVPANSKYETVTFTASIDPAATSWVALSNSDNLYDLPTGKNNATPPDGVPDLNQGAIDDYMIVTVSKGSAVSPSVSLDDNDAYNCRIGNQAVLFGTHPSVRAVHCIDWSKSPAEVTTATFLETGQLSNFFNANGPGTYTFTIEFMNRFTGAAGHGAVWLLMEKSETPHQISMPLPAVATPGDPLRWAYLVTPGTASGNVDFYALLLVGNTLFSLGPGGLNSAFEPYQSNASVSGGSGAFLPDIPLPSGLAQIDYIFGALMVRHHANIFDPANWVSNFAVSSMRFSLLSPAQQVIVGTRGYPSQFIRTFTTQEGLPRTDEAWVYLQPPTMDYFINGVIMEELTLDTTGLSPQALGYFPEHYNFDTSAADIIARHGSPVQVQNTPPQQEDFFSIFYSDTYYLYDGIFFGFNGGRLVSVIAIK